MLESKSTCNLQRLNDWAIRNLFWNKSRSQTITEQSAIPTDVGSERGALAGRCAPGGPVWLPEAVEAAECVSSEFSCRFVPKCSSSTVSPIIPSSFSSTLLTSTDDYPVHIAKLSYYHPLYHTAGRSLYRGRSLHGVKVFWEHTPISTYACQSPLFALSTSSNLWHILSDCSSLFISRKHIALSKTTPGCSKSLFVGNGPHSSVSYAPTDANAFVPLADHHGMPRSPQEELEYLKSLVKQLNEKITTLEQNVVQSVSGSKPTPSEQLRMILVGPPGAGSSFSSNCALSFSDTSNWHYSPQTNWNHVFSRFLAPCFRVYSFDFRFFFQP